MKITKWEIEGKSSFGIGDDREALFDLPRRSGGRLFELELLFALSKSPGLDQWAMGKPDYRLTAVRLLPPMSDRAKILCVGINYPERNAEYKDGSEAPKYPSLFVRFASSFVGHEQALVQPPESVQLDYEGEIVMVVGKPGRRIAERSAHDHVFGLTLMNEGTIRDWVRHGKFNVTQGKNFAASGSIGPWIVPMSTATPLDNLTLVTRVNGGERQRCNTSTPAFSFAKILSYVSTFTQLEPGDLIATGTPPGAGGRFDPPKWLKPGDVVEVEFSGIGVLRNTVTDERV